MVVPFCKHRLTELWLQGDGSLSSLPRFLAQRRCFLHCPTDVTGGVHATKERPRYGELWIEPHRLPKLPLGWERICGNVSASQEERETSQIGIVCFRHIGRFSRDHLLFAARDLCAQLISDCLSNFRLG